MQFGIGSGASSIFTLEPLGFGALGADAGKKSDVFFIQSDNFCDNSEYTSLYLGSSTRL